jgi:hypothetical protein
MAESTNGLVGRVRDQATAQLATQKNKATDGLGTVAQAVRETTQRLREGRHDTVAGYAEQAADQLDRFSEQLRQKDIGELMNDAQRLARRQPALFVGGAFALGLIGARFMKSTAPEARVSYESERDYRGEVAGMGVRPTPNAYGNRVPNSAGVASVTPPSRSTGRF